MVQVVLRCNSFFSSFSIFCCWSFLSSVILMAIHFLGDYLQGWHCYSWWCGWEEGHRGQMWTGIVREHLHLYYQYIYIIQKCGVEHMLCSLFWQIRSAIELSTSDYDKEKLQERLAKLSGGVAVLKVCNLTAVCILWEPKYMKKRIPTIFTCIKNLQRLV